MRLSSALGGPTAPVGASAMRAALIGGSLSATERGMQGGGAGGSVDRVSKSERVKCPLLRGCKSASKGVGRLSRKCDFTELLDHHSRDKNRDSQASRVNAFPPRNRSLPQPHAARTRAGGVWVGVPVGMGASSGAGSAPGSPRHVLHDAGSTSSTSDERIRSGDDAGTTGSSSGTHGGIIGVDDREARHFPQQQHHKRPSFPTVHSDPVSSLRQKYKVGKAVGKGGYAVVYKGWRVSDNLPVAVKKVDIRVMADKKKERCLREVQLLGNVQHKNVVTMLDSFLDDRYLVIVFEWAAGGDLRRFIKKRREQKKELDERETWTVFSQIVDALDHLHNVNVGVAHRDVKPANVLIVNGIVKLADLGLGKRVDVEDVGVEYGNVNDTKNTNNSNKNTNNTLRSKVGTPYYVAPEIVRGDAYGLASDVWSLGCLLYELSTLRSPFEMLGKGANVKHVFQRIGKLAYAPLTENGKLSNALVSLTTQMLSPDPEKRPTMSAIKTTCDTAVHSFQLIDTKGETRGTFAAMDLTCDRLAVLSVKSDTWCEGHRLNVYRPKPGVLSSALGQPGVFVEPTPGESDATRFSRVARLAAWLLPLARWEENGNEDTFTSENATALSLALEAYATDTGDKSKPVMEPAVPEAPAPPPSLPPTPPRGPKPSCLAAWSSPRRLRDANASGSTEVETHGAAPAVDVKAADMPTNVPEKKETAVPDKRKPTGPAPPLAALRSVALAPPTVDEQKRFALATSLADAARACLGTDAGVRDKLRFASPATVARGHGWAAVTCLSALCESAFLNVGTVQQKTPEKKKLPKSPKKKSPPRKVRSPMKPLEVFPSSKASRSPIKSNGSLVKSLVIGSPEPTAVEEEPGIESASLSPETNEINGAEEKLVSVPAKKPMSRAMQKAAEARTRLHARNSWQMVFDRGEVEVVKVRG